MNVEQAMNVLMPSEAVQTLIVEVERLREQRKQLIEELPLFEPLSKETLDILDEADIKREEEMTVDQALGSVENAGCYNTLASTVLADEVKFLREFDRERASIIREKSEEIKQLRLRQSSDCGRIRFLREENAMLRKTPPALRAVSHDVWNGRLLEKDEEIKHLCDEAERKDKKIKQLRDGLYKVGDALCGVFHKCEI